jgi:hypothetical protein
VLLHDIAATLHRRHVVAMHLHIPYLHRRLIVKMRLSARAHFVTKSMHVVAFSLAAAFDADRCCKYRPSCALLP